MFKRICFIILVLHFAAFTQEVHISRGNLFVNSFKDPIERAIFIMNDGEVFEMTSHHADKIQADKSEVTYYLSNNGYYPSDIMMIIHNHFISPFPSEADIITYRYLKGLGFKGVFAIYFTPKRKVYIYEENDGSRSH